MEHRSVQMETLVVNFLQDNGVVVPFQVLSVVVMESIAVLMDTHAMFLLVPVVKEADVYLSRLSCHHQRENLVQTVFVQMEHRSVQMETLVVNSLLENGAAVHFHKQSVAVMEFTAVLMATLAMFLLEPVVKVADMYLW